MDHAANDFKVGMKIEAMDRLNTKLICVETITRVKNNQVLIHFDSWSIRFDYWYDTTSIDIHPVGWCSKHGYTVHPPNGITSYCNCCKCTHMRPDL